MCEDMSDRAWYNVRKIDGGEKGRDGEILRRKEEVSKRRGKLSNSKLFLRG
jgi:hypothetical protein